MKKRFFGNRQKKRSEEPRAAQGESFEDEARQDGAEPSDGRKGERQSIRTRLTRFFSTKPQKEKVLRHEDFDAAGDVYYAEVSAKYKVAQRILCVLLIVFLLGSFVIHYRDITYGNLFYFVKDFGNAVDLANSGYQSLSYDVHAGQHFTMYRGGIAAVSPSGVLIFTASGRKTLKSTSTFVSPYAVSSDKHLLVYDMAGNTFAVYNSFSKVHTETLEAPVTAATLSPSGTFAVITRTAAYRSMIYVYNDSFGQIGKIGKEQYALALDIDEKGERMAVLYYDVGDGTGRTIVRMYNIAPEKRNQKANEELNRVIYETVIASQFPLGCAFAEDGWLTVVTDGGIHAFQKDGYEAGSDPYSGELSALCATEEGCAVAVRTGALNDQNRILVYGPDGRRLYDGTVSVSVEELYVRNGYVILKTDQGVTRLDTETGREESYDTHSGKLLVYDEDTAIVCADSKAVYVNFTKE